MKAWPVTSRTYSCVAIQRRQLDRRHGNESAAKHLAPASTAPLNVLNTVHASRIALELLCCGSERRSSRIHAIIFNMQYH